MDLKKVSDLVSINASLCPDKLCLFFKDEEFTYRELENKITSTANVLKSSGVTKGDRVAVLLANSPDFIISYFAVQKLGAVAVPTNIFFKDREIAANMNDCSSEYIITSSDFVDRMVHLPELAADLKKCFTFETAPFDSVVINGSEDLTPVDTPVAYDDIAMILYTSGTTGRPKGVMLTHANLIENAKSTTKAITMKHDDRMLLVLPMFHATSLMACVLMPLFAGGSIVVLDSIAETTKSGYPDMLERLRPSVVVGVPALYAMMARAKPSPEFKNYPFRLYAAGGAPLPVETIDRFKEIYGRPVLEGYGLSEASPVVAFNPLDKQKPGTIGVAVHNVEVRVVDEDDNELPVNTPGELIVRGPNVMKGYWNQPEETEKVLRNGWLHTGDVATIDEDGFITIVDRIKDLILVKGMNVYPRELEELLYKFNGVISAAVVGMPDGDGSEIPIAFVKVDPSADVTSIALKEYLKYNVAAYKVPRRFIITDDIPVNAGGKIIKKELRERVKDLLGE